MSVTLESSLLGVDNATRYEACHAVLSTAELLEAIILSVPGVKIYELQHVSTEWRAAIAPSPRIQVRMFRHKGTKPDSWRLHGRSEDIQSCLEDPGSAGRGFEFGPAMPPMLSPGFFGKYLKPFVPAKVCPLFLEDHVNLSRVLRIETWNPTRPSKLMRLSLAEVAGPSGLWKGMQLTDPPCAGAYVMAKFDFDTKPLRTGWARFTVREPQGLTIGAVRNAIAKQAANYIHIYSEHELGESIAHDSSINCEKALLEKRAGHIIKVTFTEVSVVFEDVVPVTDQEVEEVEQRRKPAGEQSTVDEHDHGEADKADESVWSD